MSPKKATRRKSERRQTPRADARLSMRVEGEPDDGARAQIVTESQNISSSGVYCYASHYLAPLSKVALTIVLPKMPGTRGAQELIKCEGIVVRCETTSSHSPERQFELACMFSDLDDERRFLIDEFVTWRNLQALRAAAGAPNGARAATTRTRKSTSSTAGRSSTSRGRESAAAPKKKAARKRSSRRALH